MGSSLSGRTSNRPVAEDCLALDLAKLMRLGPIREGLVGRGELRWSSEGQLLALVRFRLDLRLPEAAMLTLEFHVRAPDGKRREISQHTHLTSTRPHFGGRRWWMRCPITGERVRILYLQRGADKFAGRKALRLSYRVERISHFDRPFEKLFRLQRKLQAPEGLGTLPSRPKGMWRRTYDRHLARLASLDLACADEICRLAGMDGLRLSERGPVGSP